MPVANVDALPKFGIPRALGSELIGQNSRNLDSATRGDNDEIRVLMPTPTLSDDTTLSDDATLSDDVL